MAFREIALVLFALVLSCNARRLTLSNCGNPLLKLNSVDIDSAYPVLLQEGKVIQARASYDNSYSGNAGDVFKVNIIDLKRRIWIWLSIKSIVSNFVPMEYQVPCNLIPGCPAVVGKKQSIAVAEKVTSVVMDKLKSIPSSISSGDYKATVEVRNQSGVLVACVVGEASVKVKT